MSLRLVVIGLVALGLSAAAGYAVGRSSAAGGATTPPVSAVPSTVIARWTGGELTADLLRERVFAQKTAAGLRALDGVNGRAFADAAIRSALLATEARKLGLQTDPKVMGETMDALSKRLVELQFEDPSKHSKPEAAEVKAYYEQHFTEFVRPERVRVSQLFVPVARTDAAGVKKKRLELEKLRKDLAGLAPAVAASAFASRANAQTDAGPAGSGGDLGSLSKPELEAKIGPELTQQAWLLVGHGQLSEVLQNEDGLHLFRLIGREGGLEVPLDKAQVQIESRLWYSRRDVELNKFVASLGSKLGLTIDEVELNKVLSELR